jgi:hypothetical protein
MVVKLIGAAQDRWPAVNTRLLVAPVHAGATSSSAKSTSRSLPFRPATPLPTFINGQLVERPARDAG